MFSGQAERSEDGGSGVSPNYVYNPSRTLAIEGHAECSVQTECCGEGGFGWCPLTTTQHSMPSCRRKRSAVAKPSAAEKKVSRASPDFES